MRTASLGLRDAIREGKQPHIQAFVTWGDGSNEWLYDEDFMTDSISLKNGTSSSGSFDVGGAVISSFSFSLNNWDGKFDERDFVGAKITCYTGLPVSTFDFALITEDGEEFITEDEEEVLVTENARADYGTIEWLEYGTYYFVDHKTIGKTIVCETYDALKLLDENMLSDNNISYPITARQMVRTLATHNGIVLKNYNFMNGDITIDEAPDSDITERQALSYVAQMCGLYAVMNSQGLLNLSWYTEPDYSVRSRFDHNLNVDDINITGVHIYYGTGDSENYLRGHEGYVIGIRDNPFINENNYETVARNIGDNVIGLTFRSGSMNALSDITLEVGDIIHTYDDKGVLCNFIVTNLEYRLSLRETLSCDAVPVEKNDLRRMESNVFAERIKKSFRSELTSFDTQYMELSRLMSMSMGMFETKEYNEDGSFVHYLHNKPNLSESDTVWKKTIDAFSVSTDYNLGEGLRHWRAGITSNGDAVVNILSAIGINADWIETGSIIGKNGNVVFDVTNGKLTLKNSTNLVITAGNFTINSSGDVTMKGTVTATGGKIGSFNIGTGIYSGKTSLTSKENGVYIGTDGMSVGKSGNIPAFLVESGGNVSVSYLYFRNQNGSRSRYGLWSSSEDSRIISGGAIRVNTEEQGINDLYGYTRLTPYNSGSDRKIKKNIKTLDSKESLEVIKGLRPVSFEYNEKWEIDGVHHGFIAQEVESIVNWNVVEEVQKVKNIKYQEFIPDLISVVQSLIEKNEKLEEELQDYKKRLEKLEVRV